MNLGHTPSTVSFSAPDWVRHEHLKRWVLDIAALTRPAQVTWCDGSQAEYDSLCRDLVAAGTFTRLSETLRPNSFLARSDPGDVARMEDRTFISTLCEEEAGPTNN